MLKLLFFLGMKNYLRIFDAVINKNMKKKNTIYFLCAIFTLVVINVLHMETEACRLMVVNTLDGISVFEQSFDTVEAKILAFIWESLSNFI